MNLYRKFEKAFILLCAVFILSFFNIGYAAETTAPQAPETTNPKPPAAVTEAVAVKPTPPAAPAQTAAPEAVSPNLPATPEKAAPAPNPPSAKLNRNTIGCILPLSGLYAESAQKALDAIKLAAAISGKENGTKWEIVAEDSQNSLEKTKAAVATLAGIRNVMAIIAVTESAEALETAKDANRWRVPIMMITSKEGVTSAGEYVFQHFLTPSQQIKALVKYAVDNLNCAIFSILYPQDEYGEEMTALFRREVMSGGGKIEKAIPYDRNQTDFIREISSLVGSKVKAPSKPKAAKEEGTEDEEKVPVDFEALFIPDSYAKVKLIAAQLDFYNVRGSYLLGTSLWNSPSLLKNSAAYLEGAVFTDSFFVDGMYPETYMFVDAYRSAYGRSPESIDALAFDTAGMIFSALENENVKTRQDLAAAISKIRLYEGATGSSYFDEKRVAQKTAFILQIHKGQFEQVK